MIDELSQVPLGTHVKFCPKFAPRLSEKYSEGGQVYRHSLPRHDSVFVLTVDGERHFCHLMNLVIGGEV